MKIKDGTQREAYSVRLDPNLVTQLKHLAVDQKKTLSELIEDGIRVVLTNAKRTA
jgi:predicted transcriptional regulator